MKFLVCQSVDFRNMNILCLQYLQNVIQKVLVFFIKKTIVDNDNYPDRICSVVL